MRNPGARGPGVGLSPLWFGVLAGPIAWSVHLLVSYTLVTLVCKAGFHGSMILGVSGVGVLVAFVTLMPALVTLYAGTVAYRTWRRTGGGALIAADQRDEPSSFLALSGVVLSGLFFLAIVLAAVPAFVLPPCV